MSIRRQHEQASRWHLHFVLFRCRMREISARNIEGKGNAESDFMDANRTLLKGITVKFPLKH